MTPIEFNPQTICHLMNQLPKLQRMSAYEPDLVQARVSTSMGWIRNMAPETIREQMVVLAALNAFRVLELQLLT